MGTRRTEEIIADCRALSYTENFSYTEGWNQDVVVRILNLALNMLYRTITEDVQPAYVNEFKKDVISGQQSYDLPIDVLLAIRLVDVRFLWGQAAYEFVTLNRGDIQDRFDFPINIPDMYTVRSGKILLSPTPNLTKDNALIINYQKRPREMDVRRGLVAEKTDSPVTITLDFTAVSEKNAHMQEYANAQLDLVDYCCIVDTDGLPIVSAIPIQNYDTATQIITAMPNYVFPADELIALDAALLANTPLYITKNKYSSTHSELDSQCEDYLIEYVVKRMLRLQSNMGEMKEAMIQEQQCLETLINAFKRYRPSIFPVRWVRGQGRTSYPFGRRGIY